MDSGYVTDQLSPELQARLKLRDTPDLHEFTRMFDVGAVRNFNKDKRLTPMWFVVDRDGYLVIMPTPWSSDREKTLAVTLVHGLAEAINAVAVLQICESWMVRMDAGANIPEVDRERLTSGEMRVSQHPARVEVVMYSATDCRLHQGPRPRCRRRERGGCNGGADRVTLQISATDNHGANVMSEDFYTSCEERNYANDRRVRAVYLPQPPQGVRFHWEVCPNCDGRGTMVNPSIDAGGLTASDFADDPDFAESYRRGDYDVACSRCRGRTTVPVVDALPQPWRIVREDGESVVYEGDTAHGSFERNDDALVYVFVSIQADADAEDVS